MPQSTYQLQMDVPIERVWNFVCHPSNWAPLITGYSKHEMVSDRQSYWTFKGEFGRIEKTVHVRLDITEWLKPTKISFMLTGLNENFKGYGHFYAKALQPTKTKITGKLEIKAKGMMSPVINPILKTVLPKTTKHLTESIARKMTAVEIATT
ncbi:MAG TPA: SRPBCC family protein [Bacillota bacterium]|nr:SRPBCC family protein [Bacillota bacterium]